MLLATVIFFVTKCSILHNERNIYIYEIQFVQLPKPEWDDGDDGADGGDGSGDGDAVAHGGGDCMSLWAIVAAI